MVRVVSSDSIENAINNSLTYGVGFKTLREERKETGDGDGLDIDTGSLFSQG